MFELQILQDIASCMNEPYFYVALLLCPLINQIALKCIKI